MQLPNAGNLNIARPGYNTYSQAFAGTSLYFCGATRSVQGLFRVNLLDPTAEPTLQTLVSANRNVHNRANCAGLTYVPNSFENPFSGGALMFLATVDAAIPAQLWRCEVEVDTQEVSSCTDVGASVAAATGATLSFRAFRVMPTGEIIGSGAMSGSGDQLFCIDPATNTVTRIAANDGSVDAKPAHLTMVFPRELVYTADFPMPSGGAWRGVGKITKASADRCDFTGYTMLLSPPAVQADARDGVILPWPAPIRQVVMQYPTAAADDSMRYGLVSVDVSDGTVYPIYVPTAQQAAPQYYNAIVTLFGWMDERTLIFSAWYSPDAAAPGDSVVGLFAAVWDRITTSWSTRVISARQDEDAGMFHSDGSLTGMSGSLLQYDAPRATLILSGLRHVMALDVSALVDGTLALAADADAANTTARLPPMTDTTGPLTDDGSWPWTVNVDAGPWVFAVGSAYDADPSACEADRERLVAIHTLTRETYTLMPDFVSFYDIVAEHIPHLNAVAVGYTAYDCAERLWKSGIRLFDGASMEEIGVMRMWHDNADNMERLITTRMSNMMVLDDRLYFAWTVPAPPGLYYFELPAESSPAAWEAALARPVQMTHPDGSEPVYYYPDWYPAGYHMLATAWGKVWYQSPSNGCLRYYDPVNDTVVVPEYILGTDGAGTEVAGCISWVEPLQALPFGPDGEQGLFFVSGNGADFVANLWVLYNEGTELKEFKVSSSPDGFWTASIMGDGHNIYFWSDTPGANSDALYKWNGDFSAEPVLLLDDATFEPAAYWNVWGPFPELVRDYYGEGKHAVAVWTDGDTNAQPFAYCEPSSNYLMINVDEPGATERLPRPADYYVPLDAASQGSNYKGNVFVAFSGTTIAFGSRSWTRGEEVYLYDPAVDAAPVLAANINDYETAGGYAPSTLINVRGYEPPQAVLLMRLNADIFGLRQVALLPPVPSPSPTPSPSVTPSATASVTPSPSNTPTPSSSPSSSPSTSILPSPSPSPSVSVAASASAAASATPSTSAAAAGAATASPTASASRAPAGTASPTASASKQPVAKVEVALAVPAVSKATLTSSGAGGSLRRFVANQAAVAIEAVKITGLVYYNITTSEVLYTVEVSDDDAVNAAARRVRRMAAEPSGADVALRLTVRILTMSHTVADAASAALAAVLADPAIRTADAAFAAFEAALCSAVDCSSGVVIDSSVQVVTLVAPPTAAPAAEEDDKVGPGVGGFFGAAAGLLLIAGLYYYLYYKPAKAAKAAVGTSKLVVRQVNPASGESAGKASFAPQSAVV